jgi:integrase
VGTIRARRRKDGTTGYTGQIRLFRDGQLVHSESETFDRRALTEQWMRRRESELDTQRARGETIGHRMTLEQMVTWYEGRERDPWGRTKKADLKRLRAGSLASRRVDQLCRQDFIGYIEARRAGGAGPATAGNDLIWLRQVFKGANAVLGTPVPLLALDEAAAYLRGERVVAKSRQRDRRLKPADGITKGEEQQLLEYFDDRRGEIPMGEIVRYALLSARREEEITRILRQDLDRAKKTALLRDVKHPRKKVGNHKSFRMLEEAWAIIDRQPIAVTTGATGEPAEDPRVFPYNPKSIGAAFTRATRMLGIEDLHFHDLRHEATSRLFERGYSIQEVAQFTLHESWATLKRYTHLRPEDVPERNASPPAATPTSAP